MVKEKLLVMNNFSFSHKFFLPVWRTFCHIHQSVDCRLQTLSVWKSLEFIDRHLRKPSKVVPLDVRLFKNLRSYCAISLVRSKPIVSNQTIRNKKSSAKQKTIVAAPIKNKSCCVFDEISPKKS